MDDIKKLEVIKILFQTIDDLGLKITKLEIKYESDRNRFFCGASRKGESINVADIIKRQIERIEKKEHRKAQGDNNLRE